MKFSDHELKDLTIAWLAITVAFGILFYDEKVSIIVTSLTAAVTVGLGFFLHEMGHKYVAQRYHCWAEFRADYFMLGLAVIMSLFGFIFAAPGAVMISSDRPINKKKMGHISIAGPIINIVLALIFLALFYLTTYQSIMKQGAMINAWLGLFNLIPFNPFDGRKIVDWSKVAYGIMVVICLGLFLYTMLGLK